MRLWSIHPKYLDSVGLTACWREALLARKVLLGNTVGYKNHPQLIRFKQSANPILAIDAYLCSILDESIQRGYSYDISKICRVSIIEKIPVTKGQLHYEFNFLKQKLAKRNISIHNTLLDVEVILPNPIFEPVEGEVESWEVIK